jgi:hypothetical protein
MPGSATRSAPIAKGERTICRDCGGLLAAAMPVENTPHWRHKAGDCDPWSEPEGPWHLGWKELGGLPEHMKLKLVEPLRELFKDEVRRIGLELGLPHDMVYRHPFPSPGMGVRILGEVKKPYADLLREADAIFIDELRAAGLYQQVSQAFAVYLPVKSVGVVGNARRYEHVIALRAVETIDFMTALGASALRIHQKGLEPHRQRNRRSLPGGVRRAEQAAGDD